MSLTCKKVVCLFQKVWLWQITLKYELILIRECLEECNVDDRWIKIDKLKDEDFEGQVVIELRLGSVHFWNSRKIVNAEKFCGQFFQCINLAKCSILFMHITTIYDCTIPQRSLPSFPPTTTKTHVIETHLNHRKSWPWK